MNISIQTHNINLSYKDTVALKDINLEVGKGELFGLIGSDGAGKTSLFRIIATLLIPDSGHASVEGFDIVSEYKKIRRIVGYMPGRFSLYQDLSVIENLNFYASIFNTTLEKNYYLIRDIYQQIEPFKKRLAGRLSGGMKQKLALCCALIHSPDVLLLDEPTTGVDAVSRKEFWEMLKKLQENGITIIVSTPYMDEAGLCDRVALIQKGEIMRVDKPASIVAAYPYPIFAVKTDNMFKVVDDLRSYTDAIAAYRFGDSIHLSLKQDAPQMKNVSGFLNNKGYKEVEIEAIKPEIEDCFMLLMEENTKE